MKDAFAELGLPRRAALDPETIRQRLHELSKTLHPDGGSNPDAEALERANQAAAILSDPAQRLRQWIGESQAHSGSIAPELMNLFSEIGPVIQAADALIAKKRTAKTALAQALLTPEVTNAQQALMAVGAQIRESLAACEARLPQIDQDPNLETAESLSREFAFLGKWQREIQAKFSSLF